MKYAVQTKCTAKATLSEELSLSVEGQACPSEKANVAAGSQMRWNVIVGRKDEQHLETT